MKKKRVVNCYGIIEPTERTLQSYELNYFIEQRVILLTTVATPKGCTIIILNKLTQGHHSLHLSSPLTQSHNSLRVPRNEQFSTVTWHSTNF